MTQPNLNSAGFFCFRQTYSEVPGWWFRSWDEKVLFDIGPLSGSHHALCPRVPEKKELAIIFPAFLCCSTLWPVWPDWAIFLQKVLSTNMVTKLAQILGNFLVHLLFQHLVTLLMAMAIVVPTLGCFRLIRPERSNLC